MSPWMRLAGRAAAALGALAFCGWVHAQRPAPDGTAVATPALAPVIESGAHVGPITAWDVQGRRLVTAGADRTVRLWTLPDLRPIAVIHPPRGPGEEISVVSVALRADERRVAVLVRRADAPRERPMAILEYALPSRDILMPLAPRASAEVGALAYGRDGVLRTEPAGDTPALAAIDGIGEVHFFASGALQVVDATGRTLAAVESAAFDVAPGSLRVGPEGRVVSFADVRDPRRALTFALDPAGLVD